MIHYSKRFWGLPLIFRVFGSPFPRTIPFAVVSVAISVVLQSVDSLKRDIVQAFGHPYPFQVYAFVIGFLVVLRTNHSLARFMEARSNVELMGSKWADAVMMLQAFDSVSTGEKIWDSGRRGNEQRPGDGSDEFIARVVHLVSLMHGLALQQLRGDENLDNLVIARQRSGPGSDLKTISSANQIGNVIAADVVVVDDREGTRDENAPHVRVNLSGSALDPEKSKATFKLKGAHDGAAAVNDARQARGEILSVFSLTERSEIWHACCVATPLAVVGGVDGSEIAFLSRLNCDRVYVVMSLIQCLIVSRSEEKDGLRIPPPILSRCYQVLSDGLLGFNQADKLAKTPFPMPYAQMLTALLLVFNITLPVMIAGNVNALWLAIVVNLVSTVAYQGLNETARELEDPFKPTHVNDLGLPQLQAMFNAKIRAATPGAELQLDRIEQLKVVRSMEERD
jgi:predicted membrane chloride channel (bestrophin family)